MSFGREDVRLETDMDVVISTVYDEDGILVPAVQEIHMTMTNLSATGISLKSEKEFNQKQSFLLTLELNSEKINLMPVIVRKTKDGKTFSYGCKLMHLDSKEEQAIRNYIFNSQLNKRRFKKI